MSNSPELFHQKFSELFDLYEKVKEAIILAENIDPERKIYIAPLNQLRSSLDHLFKAARFPESMEYEFKEGMEHISRAGYDAFEVMAGNIGLQIVDLLKEFDTETLTTVFPEYYKEIKPQLEKAKIDLKDIRTRKNHVEEGKAFNDYFSEVEKLLDLRQLVYTRINSLQEYKSKKEAEKGKNKSEKNKTDVRNKWQSRLWAFLIGLSIGLIILFVS